MSTDHTRIDHLALTLEQHRALNLTRPFTDHPLGFDSSRRLKGVAASATFLEPDLFDIANRANPETVDIAAHDRIRQRRRKAALAVLKNAQEKP